MDYIKNEYIGYVAINWKFLFGVFFFWVLGYFNVSVAWLIIGAFTFLYARYTRNERKRELGLIRELTNKYSVDGGCQIPVKYLPSWSVFPDVHSAEWMNQMIKHLWPFLSSMLSDILKNEVTAEIQKEVPSLLKSIHFDEVNLGSYPLRINGIKVYTELVRPTEMIMDLDIAYAGDAVITLALNNGIKAGLSDLQLRGKLRLDFNPLLSVSPMLGAIRLYFLEPPEISYDMTNLLNILDFPGLGDIFRNVINTVVEQYMVMPNKITVPLADEKYLQSIKYSKPLGVLQVKILAGKNLTAHDTSMFGKSTSDPYVITKVGKSKHQVSTKAVKNSLNPVWENESFTVFVNTVVGFKVRFEVFDEDTLKDDQMGHVDVSMSEIAYIRTNDLWLKLEGTQSGSLHVICNWYDYSNDPKDIVKKDEKDKRETCCLFVELDYAINLPVTNIDSGTCNAYVEITVGEKTFKTMIKQKTDKPVWQQLYSFFVKNPENDIAKIKVMDNSSEEPLGTLHYKIADLLTKDGMKEDERLFKLENCKTEGQLRAAFELKALIPPSDEKSEKRK